MRWLQDRLNSIVDNLIFTALSSGGVAVVTIIQSLPWYAIIGITIGFFIGLFLFIRLVAYLQFRFVIARLVSIGIYTDVPDNILRVLYHDKEQLKIGLPDSNIMNSNQDRLVYGDFRTHNIVQMENRTTGSFWVLTDLGKRIILYLEKNPRVLDKEGSPHK